MECPRPILSVDALRAVIPAPNSKVRLKILDHLERHSLRMIELSTMTALACGAGPRAPEFVLRTTPGVVVALDNKQLRVADVSGELCKAWALQPGTTRGIGGLFVVAGIGETLRVNGRARTGGDGASIDIDVDQVFLQCPKAFVRSRLWDPATWTADAPGTETQTTQRITDGMRTFIERAPFALIATSNTDGSCDVSPRGDPAGFFVRCLDDKTLLIPDRTGNHLVDSLLNILNHPVATLVVIHPGRAAVLQLRGRARLTADAELLAASAVNDKAPKVGILLDVDEATFAIDALVGLWSRDQLVDPKNFPTMGEMILDQVNPTGRLLNRVGSAIFDLGNAFHKKRRLY